MYYGGVGFDRASPTYLTATGTDNWSYPLDASKLTSLHTYRLYARATDDAGNAAPVSSSGFSYDDRPVAPTSTSEPTISGTLHVGGTASAGAGAWGGRPLPTPESMTYQWQAYGYRAAVLGGGPAGYWRLGSGPVMADESGDNNGTPHGEDYYFPGYGSGGAHVMSLGGGCAVDSCQIDLANSVQFDSRDFTIEAWYLLNGGESTISGIWGSGAGSGAINVLRIEDGRPIWLIGDTDGHRYDLCWRRQEDDNSFCGGVGWDDWHHVVAKRAGSSLYLYVDGWLVEEIDNVELSDVDAPGAATSIATDGGHAFHYGYLADVAIYDRALSGPEVTGHRQMFGSPTYADIPGATAPVLSLGSAQGGTQIRVNVTASTTAGSASRLSQSVAVLPTLGYPPSTPSFTSPADGATVPTATPTLAATTVDSGENDPITWQFRIFSDAGCTTSRRYFGLGRRQLFRRREHRLLCAPGRQARRWGDLLLASACRRQGRRKRLDAGLPSVRHPRSEARKLQETGRCGRMDRWPSMRRRAISFSRSPAPPTRRSPARSASPRPTTARTPPMPVSGSAPAGPFSGRLPRRPRG